MNDLIKEILIFICVIVGAMILGKLSGHIWVGIVIIVIFLLYIVINKGYKSSEPSTEKLPTNTYMKYVGGRCPDYFNYLGKDGENDVCQNTYGINVGDNDKCYDDAKKKIKNFPTYNKYPMSNKDKSKKERCQWISECGLTDGQFASWSGMKC